MLHLDKFPASFNSVLVLIIYLQFLYCSYCTFRFSVSAMTLPLMVHTITHGASSIFSWLPTNHGAYHPYQQPQIFLIGQFQDWTVPGCMAAIISSCLCLVSLIALLLANSSWCWSSRSWRWDAFSWSLFSWWTLGGVDEVGSLPMEHIKSVRETCKNKKLQERSIFYYKFKPIYL